MLNFGNKVEERSNDLIPKDTLLWMRITVRGMKNSRDTNGRFVDLELTIAENQPYAGRKVWDTIMDPYDSLNSQAARDMGTGKIRRILEGVFGARPDNPNSYSLPNYEALGGQHLVPVRIDIQKAKAGSGYDDKNTVDYLSPHSSVKKVVECYNLLRSGVSKYEKAGGTPAPAPQQGGFGMQPAPQPQPGGFTPPAAAPASVPGGNAPGWLAPSPAAAPAPMQAQPVPMQTAPAPQPQAAPAGFQPPAQHTAPAAAVGFQQMPPAATPAQGNNPPGFQPPQQAGFAPAAGNTPQTSPMQSDTVNAVPSPSNAPAQGWAPPQGAMPAQLPGQGNGQQ